LEAEEHYNPLSPGGRELERGGCLRGEIHGSDLVRDQRNRQLLSKKLKRGRPSFERMR
jgi:hypothetical protein